MDKYQTNCISFSAYTHSAVPLSEQKANYLSAVMDMKAKELTNLDKWYGMGKGDP